MRCPKCNFPVLPKFDKCPKCGAPLKEAPATKPTADFDFDAPAPKAAPKPAAGGFDFDAPSPGPVVPKVPQPVDGVSIISGKAVWSLGPGQIARRVTEREMADCGAVKGVVVQDGVTAAVFSDGKLVQTLDGGIYRFSNEIVRVPGKPAVMKTPQGGEKPVAAEVRPVAEEKKQGFLKRLFGAKKETKETKETKPGAPSTTTVLKSKPAVSEQRNTSVVVIYLISNRVFEESFGSAGSVTYEPFEVTAAGTPLKVGASMQMRVTDFETFRRQYLVDSNEVSVETIRRMMTPWVKQILEHDFAPMQVTDGRLTPQQQESLKQTLGTMLQNRLFGMSIINIFDLVTRDVDFERLREQQRELARAEKENEVYVRETEFRNRLADFEARQEAERLTKDNDASLSREKEYSRFETALAELNRDRLLTEDELKQFMAQHEMEIRLADAARNADEQTRRYESEKILNDLADRKLIDDDERKMIEERVANGQFVRGQLNDLLRHKTLVSNTLEKLRLDTDLALQQAKASHELDVNAMRQETERTDLESILYGKRYAIDRQRAVDELELNSIRLDADIETRRKEDTYAEEKYQLDRKHEHDEWAEKFMREGREMDRSRENRRADADLDFDIRSRNEEHDFEMGRRRDEHDFDMTARKAEFDFDLDDRRQDKDVERTSRLSAVEQEAADRQHARDMEMRRQQQEELRLKGNIAMENMKAMMEAKRAAKKDELDAATDQLNIKSQMTAEQIAAEQLRDLDASAQAGFMDALKEKSSSAKEAELARREAEMTRRMHEQMMGRADSMHEQNRNDLKEMMAQMMQMQQMSQQQAMDLARHSMDTSASIASSQAAANASAAERRATDLERDNQRYREDARHAQERVDSNQAQSLDYATRVTQTAMENDVPVPEVPTAARTQAMREEISTVPLNTAWLRDHGFAGSFNELAGQLSSLGASISKDFDADGNPVIVVDGLPEGQIFDTLRHFGVEF